MDPLFAAVQRALAGQYSVERELGRGGMGVVYLAREVQLDRYVALKVLPAELANDGETRERFLREARVAASLSHPNIVPIFRVGEAGEVVYFSMAFVDGETLGERLRSRGPLTDAVATKLLREVAQALAYSHGRGVIHRDVKPDNILIERESGRSLVTDFGIAAGARETTSDFVAGTKHFMSPEQSDGASVDERSDIYSLGIVGFLAMSGRFPKSDESLSVAAPATSPRLAAAIDRAIRRSPDERFGSAEAFASAAEEQHVARIALPQPVREWLEARDPWTLPLIGWSLLMAGVGVMQLIGAPAGTSPIVPFIVSALSLIPATLFQSRIARRVFDAGYTVDDLRDALEVWRRERESERELQRATAPWWHAVARTIAWTPAALFASMTYNPSGFKGLGIPLFAASLFAMVVSLPSLNAIGVPLFPRLLRPSEKSLARRFWNSRLGEWAEKLLMIGRRRLVASHAFRPTERVLVGAVDDLFRSLPTAFREQLPQLPGVAMRLQALARDARESLSHLENVTAVARDAELSAARDRARKQLTESVSALETIRLDLLRLLGGDADLRPTTTVLDAAKRVDSDLRRLRAARADAERALLPIGLDLKPHTPV